MVQLDDPVHGRLEDQTEMLLGLAERLVGLANALQGEIGLREGALLVAQRAPGIGVGLRAADLVREDPSRHADPEHRDDGGRLDGGEPARVVERSPR